MTKFVNFAHQNQSAITGIGPSLSAARSEGADASADIQTTASMAIGDSFSGSLSLTDTSDWVKISLTAGTTYEFEMKGADSGNGTLPDPWLELKDSTGTMLTLDYQSGVGNDAKLRFTATETGTYFLAAEEYYYSAGTYVVTSKTLTPASNDAMADYLVSGFWYDIGYAPAKFNTSGSNTISVNLTGLTAEGKQLARWALDAWASVANLKFAESSSSSANILFDDSGEDAYTSRNFVGTSLTQSFVTIGAAWLDYFSGTMEGYNLQTYIHEIGHALGLGHQGNYDGGADYGVNDTFWNDSWQTSIMSYFDQDNNTAVNATYAYVFTPMMVDIIAIQSMYGAPTASSVTAGDTTWGGVNSSIGTYLDSFLKQVATQNITSPYLAENVAFTIYDQGGYDTLDLSNVVTGNFISLVEETFSNIGGSIGNVGIARGTVIEAIKTGQGDDTVVGNDAANVMFLNNGNDSVFGAGGDDSIYGGNGADDLYGGDGSDILGGAGGNDYLEGGDGDDVLFGAGGVDVLYGGLGADTLFGGDQMDQLFGGSGDNLLYGGNQSDTIIGAEGNDTLGGATGDDLFDAGSGDDLIFGAADTDTVYGGDGADTMFGGFSNDLLDAGTGNDQLYGGDGNDTMLGGDGDDYLGGALGDDSIDGGQGADQLIGGDGNDALYGGDGADRLLGAAGSDIIDGGAGNDMLYGGSQADTFVFKTGHGDDVVYDFDASSAAEKIDFSMLASLNSIGDVLGASSQVNGGDVLIVTGADSSILLKSVLLANLDATDFIF